MSNKKNWGVFVEPTEKHVVPMNDLHEHSLVGTNCHCDPEMIPSEPLPIIVHAAWDCRELIEQAEVIKEAASA